MHFAFPCFEIEKAPGMDKFCPAQGPLIDYYIRLSSVFRLSGLVCWGWGGFRLVGRSCLYGSGFPGYCKTMTIEAIKNAIEGLPADDRHSLATWLNEIESDAWDRQMASDFAPDGRGAAWAESVKRQIAEGKARPMEEGFAARRRPGA